MGGGGILYQKLYLFCIKNISTGERIEKTGPAQHRRQSLGRASSKPRSLGFEHLTAWQFFLIFRKNSQINAIWIIFCTLLATLERTKLQNLKEC